MCLIDVNGAFCSRETLLATLRKLSDILLAECLLNYFNGVVDVFLRNTIYQI